MAELNPKAHFNLTTPCENCPFRKDVRPFISLERAQEILDDIILKEDNHFHCHKTVNYKKKFSGDVAKAQLCAGAMILQEKAHRPSVMARVGAVFGYYNRDKLDMDAPVYDSPAQMLEAHKKEEKSGRYK